MYCITLKVNFNEYHIELVTDSIHNPVQLLPSEYTLLAPKHNMNYYLPRGINGICLAKHFKTRVSEPF